jgi:hypothetical protein
MVKAADALLKKIKEDVLTDSFDPEFISELQVLAQLYSKISLPKK